MEAYFVMNSPNNIGIKNLRNGKYLSIQNDVYDSIILIILDYRVMWSVTSSHKSGNNFFS